MTGAKQANLWKELRQIHRRLEVLEDAVLSPDDREALKEARREFKEGKTVSHKEVIKEVPKEVVKEVPREVIKEVPKEVIKEVTKTVTVETISPVSYVAIGIAVVLVVVAGVIFTRRKKA